MMEIQGLTSLPADQHIDRANVPDSSFQQRANQGNDQSVNKDSGQLSDDRKISHLMHAISDTLSGGENAVSIDLSNVRLAFSSDEDAGVTVIKIIDNKTEEVIRQIPPEEIVTLKKKMGELLGLLMDKKA